MFFCYFFAVYHSNVFSLKFTRIILSVYLFDDWNEKRNAHWRPILLLLSDSNVDFLLWLFQREKEILFAEKQWSTGKARILSYPTPTWITSLNNWKSPMDLKQRRLCGTFSPPSSPHPLSPRPLDRSSFGTMRERSWRSSTNESNTTTPKSRSCAIFNIKASSKLFTSSCKCAKIRRVWKWVPSMLSNTEESIPGVFSLLEWTSEEQSNDASRRTKSSEEDGNSDQGIPSAK